MSNVIHLDAWRAATFRGSRDEPDMRPEDIAECVKEQAKPEVRARIDKIGMLARAAAEERHYRLSMEAARILSEGRGPDGGGAA